VLGAGRRGRGSVLFNEDEVKHAGQKQQQQQQSKKHTQRNTRMASLRRGLLRTPGASRARRPGRARPGIVRTCSILFVLFQSWLLKWQVALIKSGRDAICLSPGSRNRSLGVFEIRDVSNFPFLQPTQVNTKLFVLG